jgi:hypothetical protein
MLVAAVVGKAEAQMMNGMPGGALAVWQMGDERSAAGGCSLQVHGTVELGVPLAGAEREASLQRGGDGKAARFAGGYLGLANEAEFALGDGPCTLAVRLRDPAGTWLYPILGSSGSTRAVSLALRGVDGRLQPMEDRQLWGGAVSTPNAWMFKPDGPRSVSGNPALLEVLWGAQEANPARLQQVQSIAKDQTPWPLLEDTRAAVMRIGFPVQLIDPTAWHDLVIRLTGPKLELWIDGVLVDEEYPIGVTRRRTLPFLIGAGHEDGEVRTGFAGLIDHVAVWPRALSEAEITALCGGAAQVRARELAILGDESPSMQYFRPRGHNRKAGDCIPYWDARTSTFRLFYLILRRNMHSKWDGGHGGLEIWQASTQDLKAWQHHPVTIPISEPWEAWNGTGGVACHDGVYHWFYPTPDYDGKKSGIQLAISRDGVHFEKTEPHPFLPGGDCEVYEDAKGLFHLLRAGPGRQANTPELHDKTLVAWVRLADLDQRGGSVLTLEHPDGQQFDAIVFGEAVARRWMPGSNMFLRTPGGQDAWPEESAAPGEVVQMAMVHAGSTVTLYRNGALYATAEIRQAAVFPAGSSVISGRRHMTAAGRNSHFHGSVLDARLYGIALTAAEIGALRPNAPGGPPPLAWFNFAANRLRDQAGAFPDGTLTGTARLADGALQLNEDGHFRSLGTVTTLARLTSRDLREWTPVAEPFIETDVRNVAMCPHLFRFGDWYYFIGGTQWFRSRNEFGPWTPHEPGHLCDLFVPKTAAFGASRRLYAGFLFDGGWGGNEVIRELVQDAEGWLGTRFVPEMIPACGEALPVAFQGEGLAPAGNTLRLNAAANARAEAVIPDLAGDCRIQLQVVPEPGVRSLGLVLRAGPGADDGCALTFDLARATVTFAKRTESGGKAEPGPLLTGVHHLDQPFTLDLICRHDILDAEIAGFRATCTRFWNPKADRIRLFVEGGAATFREVRVRRLAEVYSPYPKRTLP